MADLEALNDMLERFNGDFDTKLEILQAAADRANAAAASADQALNPFKFVNRIYVADYGDDDVLSATNAQSPVRTMGEALRRQRALTINQIRVLTDIVFEDDVIQTAILPSTEILSYDAETDRLLEVISGHLPLKTIKTGVLRRRGCYF